jgi:hypothetical protein
MQSARQTYRQPQGREEKIFFSMPDPSLASRLRRQLGDLSTELAGGFTAYLQAAFLPDRRSDWFPIRLASAIGTALAHPLAFAADAALTDEIGRKRRRRLIPVLAASAAVHGALIAYLIYLALFSPFANLLIVNRAYRQFDPTAEIIHLKYPPQMLKGPQGEKTLTLEEIREQAKKRREQAAKERAAREEKERIEREKAEKARKEAEQKAAELAAKEKEKTKPTPTEFGEINEAPLKDLVGELYSLYAAGTLDVNLTKLTVMVGFKIEKDGSLSGIRLITPSGNALVDKKAQQILWMIGESHALGPIVDLSSGSIKLDLTENTSRLTVTAFAATPEAARAKADLLNFLFAVLRMKQKKDSPDVAELLSLLKVRSDNKRIDAELSVSRARAAEMMNARFGSKQ